MAKNDVELESDTKDVQSVDETRYERKPLKLGGTRLIGLAFSTLGIIYSDIGTSPLYVLNGIWSPSGDAPSEEDIIGGISAIIWALTLIPLIKYVGFAMEFGTAQGEGGPFALFMTLFPSHEPIDQSRSLTTYTTLDESSSKDDGRLAKLTRFKWPLMIWTFLGTALTLSDGILTPAVSVTSAVGGIAVAQPSITNSVIPVSIAFILVLFAIQPLGTQRISLVFAPITAIWLMLLGATGIYNIVAYPGIWRAYDPSRAVLWFVRTKNYDALAGVLLAITGCEAMFANLGQFNKGSIRIAFATFVYPMLILAYLGQGARLITHPDVIAQVFYRTIPGSIGGPLYWIVFIFAIFATLIASQAMMTGTFTLIHQLIGMHAFPSFRIKYTSNITAGQVYIGAVNWLLMIGTIAVVGGFGSSTALTLAYGFAVSTVLFVTTTLIALSIPFVRNMPYILGLAFLLFFGFFDGLFWGAALKKVPHGAWFPLALGGLLVILMVFWTWGRGLESAYDNANIQKLTRLIGKGPTPPKLLLPSSPNPDLAPVPEIHDPEEDVNENERDVQLFLHQSSGEHLKLERIPVLAVFHRNDAAGRGVPHAFVSFLQRYPALPQAVIFLTTRTVGVPHIDLPDRYVVTKVRSLPGFYGVTMRLGYKDLPNPSIPNLLPGLLSLESTALARETLQNASLNITHIIPSYQLVSQTQGVKIWNWARRFLVEGLYGRARVVFPDREYDPRPSADFEDNMIQVGVIAVI